jgi:Concanavalin A-like lectin/glucanases superfamily
LNQVLQLINKFSLHFKQLIFMKTKPMKMILTCGALVVAMLFIDSCSKDDPAAVIDKEGLKASIVAANLLLTTTFEGAAPDNYVRGSQHPLSHAVVAAQVIADLTEVSQATVTGSKASLDNAITTYGTQKVVPIDPTNLVGQWTFDQITSASAGAVVKDYSGNNRDGAIKVGHVVFGAGTASLAADRYGIAGKALLLNKGANIEIPYNTALNAPSLSFSAWIRLAEVRNNRFIGLQSWLGYKFEVQDGNRPFLSIGHSAGTYDRDAGVAIGQNVWYHLVVTYTANSMIFYINGVMVPSGTWTNTPNPAASISGKPYNLVLGCDFPTDKYSSDANGTNFGTVGHADYQLIPAAWGGYLNGYLDEVRIYKSALTATQVTSIYDLEKP